MDPKLETKLTDHSSTSTERTSEQATKSLPYWQLFRYATFKVRLLLVLSLINAMGHGVLLPVLTLLFGRVTDEISALYVDENSPGYVPIEKIASSIADTVRLFLILSFVAWVLSMFQLFFALRAANILGNLLRVRFFNALLRQSPPFYDAHSPGSLTQLVVSDVALIQAGVGDKLATAVQYITTFVTGLIVGFIKGWQLTLVILAITPVLLASGFVFGKASTDATGDSLGSYATANGIASETLALIRTVTTFSAQKQEVARYDQALKRAYKGSARAAMFSGLGLGTAMFCILSTYGLAFWFGALKVREESMKPGDVLVTFFALTLGASSLGTSGPAFKSFSKARAAAPRVYEILSKISDIDPMDDAQGDIIDEDQLQGTITFEGVDFDYPNRNTNPPEQQQEKHDEKLGNVSQAKEKSPELVLHNFNLQFAAGCSEALVGKSGSGKSTIARLIQRLYDPSAGAVKLDGRDIRTLNVRWLRSQMGVVSQTPSLFMLSIRDNIALGSGLSFSRDKDGKGTVIREQEVSFDDVRNAAKLANAHDFIMRLPHGYDTMVGERGATLSGGQMQRICIARALIRNPKILVLDESTASLDTESERVVQKALERASHGRTTVTIAHRLSTVRNATRINCVQDGHIVESGSHDELMTKNEGFYKGLFELQDMQKESLQKEKELLEEEAKVLASANAGTSIGEASTQGPNYSISKMQGSEATEGEDEGKRKRSIDKGLFMRTFKLNFAEGPLILIGCVGAILFGVVWPIAALVLSEMVDVLSQKTIDMSDVRFWALGFVVLAVMAFFGNVMQHSCLGVSGERLTFRIRSDLFRVLLRQEIGYFDAHSAGEMTTLLASDAGMVKGLTGELLGVGLNVIAALIAGVSVSFTGCWATTLIVLALVPGVGLGAYFEMQASAGIDSGARQEFAKANTVAAEAIDNIATVRAVGKEQFFLEKFASVIKTTDAAKLRKDMVTALAFGFSEFSQYIMWYATFKAGGEFMESGLCVFRGVLLSALGLMFAAITLGNCAVFAPDVGAANVAATQVYRVLDRASEIDPGDSEEDERLSNLRGDVGVKKVYFEYPTRPNVAVLRGLSLHARPGETVAIVGQSGHGKSTIIGLLQRFYNYRAGSITLDDTELTAPTPMAVRSHIGTVSQLPELFNRSVFDNIAYGLGDGMLATKEMVEQAAKIAFAHEFIMALPEGYDTMVGERGESLSGGQRQRVAIARSVIREPKLLLLDEATSALDNISERAVQEALDNAGKGRTTIVVAHRLSTIKNADRILVVQSGKVVEMGTHNDLLRKDGAYARLVENQLTEI